MYSYPSGHLLYRKLTREYPRVVRGEGCYLFDDEGNRYLDACGGAFVTGLGHGNAAVARAIAEQAGCLSYVNGTQFTNEPAESLAAELARHAPGDLDRAFFLSSGSDAVEASLKLARQYWMEQGKTNKHKIVALSPSYHGNTMLALSASARDYYKSYYGEWLIDVRSFPAPYAYRCHCLGEDGSCARCSADALEDLIVREGAATIAAFIAEPVGGSSTGASLPRPDYFRRVRDICDRHDVLFIADEIITGLGRTGTWSALEPYGTVPDLLVLGKGLAGGAAPLSAVLAPRRIVDVIARGSGSVMHGQTFAHHPVSCAAGLATVREIERLGLVRRSAEMGAVMHRRLDAVRDLPFVGDVRGRGLLCGIEFVSDKSTRAPIPRTHHFAETFAEVAQRAGLIVWPNHGMADGVNGDLVMLAPPYIITEEEIDEIARLFSIALERTLAAVKLPNPGRPEYIKQPVTRPS